MSKFTATNEKSGNKRILMLGYIDNVSANTIIKAIVEINLEDELMKSKKADYEPEPIQIIINSYGGLLYDGLGIIGAIETSKTPVHTVCYGSAMSMALFVLAAGHHRKASKYSTLMYHELSTGVEDKMSNVEDELAECKRVDVICNGILAKKTKFKKKDTDNLKKTKSDWYFTPSIAKSKCLIDEII